MKCSVEGCDQKKHVRGLCKRHDYRVRTHGSPGRDGALARAELREYREWKLRTGRSLVDA